MIIKYFYRAAWVLFIGGGIALGANLFAAPQPLPRSSMGSMGGMKMGPIPGHLPSAGKLVNYHSARRFVAAANREGTVATHGKDPLLTFEGKAVRINMIAVQPGFPDQTFELHKLVDPAIAIQSGAKVTISLLNMDYGPGMLHGLVIGKARPPYHMVVVLPVKHQLVQMPLILPRLKKSVTKSHYFLERARFTAPKRPGTYYYFCQMPMHAKSGMYGKFIILK